MGDNEVQKRKPRAKGSAPYSGAAADSTGARIFSAVVGPLLLLSVLGTLAWFFVHDLVTGKAFEPYQPFLYPGQYTTRFAVVVTLAVVAIVGLVVWGVWKLRERRFERELRSRAAVGRGGRGVKKR